MALDPSMFRDYPDLKVGDMVKYKAEKSGHICRGVGWVRMIWMGIEEICEIQTHGKQLSLCRALGDEIELL